MQLTFDAEVEDFRAEFVGFLAEHLPPEARAHERPSSTSHVPEWSRRWQRLQFDVVNGQKVWTSGAHDADVVLTFVRTDPNAAKHKGISALLIRTDTPGVVCRPFASV